MDHAAQMDVLGVGFGRTGTTSLKAALERLGFGPCYHMLTVLAEPRRLGHWSAGLESGEPDWARAFAGFRSSLDWPAMTWWREMVDAHPSAKVILTVRDPWRWYDSVARTVLWTLRRPPGLAGAVAERLLGATNWWYGALLPVMRAMILDRSLAGLAGDPGGMVELFGRHTEEVRAYVPAERLLIFDVSQGWEPLCAFLGVEVPDEPFPHLNDAEEFRRRHRRHRVRAAAPIAAVAAAALAVAFSWR